MSVPDFTEEGWSFAVAARNRPDLQILFFADGRHAFRHSCTVPDAEVPDLATIRCSPWLQHDVQLWNGEGPPVASVSPSILCGRCQIHGFFTANEWSDA